MKKAIHSIILFIFCLVFFSSCANTPDAVLIRNTDKAATEQIYQLETAAAMPPTETASPIVENTLPVYTFTPIILPTTLRYINPATAAPSVITSGGLKDSAAWVSFSPVSNTTVLPGQVFYLTIELNNTGTTTWSTDYDLVFYNGTQLAYSSSYALSYAVGVGSDYTTSMYLIAPSATGTYTSNWYLADAYGTPFFYFSYTLIVGDYTSLTSIATYTATITTTPQFTATTGSYFGHMCSSAELSLQQGEGCETYCKNTVPYQINCYYNGILNSTATPIPTSTTAPSATQAPTATPVPPTALPTNTPVTPAVDTEVPSPQPESQTP